MTSLASRVTKMLGSRRFYWVVIGFFALEALWIAFSAVYPMAFDEEFHLGVIRIYSKQWLPFLTGQPDGANTFGALATDPSYLYHYLMSFPYRLIAVITDNLMVQVVALRVLNVAMMVAGLVMFGKVLRKAGASPALTGVATLLFALVPAVVLLAGQINYDNLLLLLFAWVCLLVLYITDDLRARKIVLTRVILLVTLLMAGCLVKYAFLPIALATFIYIVALAWVNLRGIFWSSLVRGFSVLSKNARLTLFAVLVVFGGLFIQRYGVNVIRYHNPVPSCDTVLSVEDCMEYGPWGRNYRYAADKPAFDPSPLAYMGVWVQSLHYRLFFMITGPPTYINYPPALFPSAAFVVVVVFGSLALLFYWRRVFFGQPFLIFLLLLSATYIGILWLQNYMQYLETGRPVAINGRYLIPLLLPFALLFGTALNIASRPLRHARVLIATLLIVCFLQGGGTFGFILRSDKTWYWPNKGIVTLNETARRLLSPIMYIGPKHY